MTKEMEKPDNRPKLTAGHKLPEIVGKVIDFEGWARSVAFRDDYHEPNPDYISMMLAMQSIMANTIEEAFAQGGVVKLQEILFDRPGETTGPIEIHDVYVAESDFETGNPCYVIMTWTDLASGADLKVTTGATNIQATLIGLLKLGMFTIKCQIKRGDSKDKGGKYLLHLLPPD